MSRWWLFFIFIFSSLPVFFHLHIVEKDFYEILGSADGIRLNEGYCFLQIKDYSGIKGLSGITARPPLIQFLLSGSFALFGHTLLAIYIVYAIPRILIYISLFLLARLLFPPLIAYITATLPLFFPFFETYAISTLKADVFVVAGIITALYVYTRWIRTHSPFSLFLTSLCLSLTILTKETAITIVMSIFIGVYVQIFLRSSRKLTNLCITTIPPLLLIGPFILFGLRTTGRIFPNIWATARDITSFPQNIVTYIATFFYYSGINFRLNKGLAISSFGLLIIILTGIVSTIKKRQWELIIPLCMGLVGISFIKTRVIQGDSIGNREIIHRIAYVVPFSVLYLMYGVQAFSLRLRKVLKLKKNRLFYIVAFLVSMYMINRYFTAPYALDYTDREFYVDAQAIFSDRKMIPYSEFRHENNKCMTSYVSGGQFLLNHYRPYKVSAFPNHYKELLISVWFFPIGIYFLIFLLRRYVKIFK